MGVDNCRVTGHGLGAVQLHSAASAHTRPDADDDTGNAASNAHTSSHIYTNLNAFTATAYPGSRRRSSHRDGGGFAHSHGPGDHRDHNRHADNYRGYVAHSDRHRSRCNRDGNTFTTNSDIDTDRNSDDSAYAATSCDADAVYPGDYRDADQDADRDAD